MSLANRPHSFMTTVKVRSGSRKSKVRLVRVMVNPRSGKDTTNPWATRVTTDSVAS